MNNDHVPAKQAAISPNHDLVNVNRQLDWMRDSMVKLWIQFNQHQTITTERHKAQTNHNNNMIDDIAHLQDRIVDFPFRNQVEILETEVAGVRENVSALATAITLLQDRMGRMENLFQGLQNRVNDHQILVTRSQVELHVVISNLQVTRKDLVTMHAALRNAGLLSPNIGIQNWINSIQQAQALPVNTHVHGPQANTQASAQALGVTNRVSLASPSIGVATVRAAAEGPTSVPNLTHAGGNISRAVNGDNANANLPTAQPTIVSASTPSFRTNLNPKAPPFIKRETDSAEEPAVLVTDMSNSKDSSQAGPGKAQPKFKTGMEDSMWADANYKARQFASKGSNSTHQPVIPQPKASHQTETVPWFPNAPTKENWDADLKKSRWATPDEGTLPAAQPSPLPATQSSVLRSNSAVSEPFTPKNLNATVEDAHTSPSDIAFHEDTKALDSASNSTTTDVKTEFLAGVNSLAQQLGLSASQVVDFVSVAGYGNVEHLGTGNEIGASTGTGNEANDDGQLIPGLGMDIEGSTAMTGSAKVQHASEARDINIMDSNPQVIISKGPGPVTIDGNVALVFHNVKFKGTSAGSAANQPVNRLGHLNKVAFVHASIDLVLTIARGNQPKISIIAITDGEAFVTVTFILPTYVQSMEFDKRVANEPGVLLRGSEPMIELSATKDPETGVIPGHLRKIVFKYNTCNTHSAVNIHKNQTELQAMTADEAAVYRFFKGLTHWEGGAVEALFTDEGHDASLVDEVLGAYEALYKK